MEKTRRSRRVWDGGLDKLINLNDINNLMVSRIKKPKKALTINREGFFYDKFVYIACANKQIQYGCEKSKIVYIGETSKGMGRTSNSAAKKGRRILKDHGINQLDFFIVKCGGIQSIKTWKALETDLIITFRSFYGKPPILNIKGKNIPMSNKSKHFKENRLKTILNQFSK